MEEDKDQAGEGCVVLEGEGQARPAGRPPRLPGMRKGDSSTRPLVVRTSSLLDERPGQMGTGGQQSASWTSRGRMGSTQSWGSGSFQGSMLYSRSFLQVSTQTSEASMKALVFRFIVPLIGGIVCPGIYMFAPLTLGCEGRPPTYEGRDGAEHPINFWVFLAASGIYQGIYGTTYFIIMYLGLMPCPNRGPCIAAVVANFVGYPGSMALCYSLGYPDWAYWIGESGATIVVVSWMLPILLLSVLYCVVIDDGQIGFFEHCRSQAVRLLRSHAMMKSFGEPEVWHDPPVQDVPLPSFGALETHGEEVPCILRPAFAQWLLLVMLFAIIAVVHWLMQVMLAAVINGGTFRIWLYIVYLMMTAVLKDAIKAVGFLLDSGKSGVDYCGYYLGEVVASLFYFFFYRAMFDHVTTWTMFCTLHFIHLVMEWVAHPLRATDRYFKFAQGCYARAPAPFKRVVLGALLACQPSITNHEWACYIALDTALRFYIQMHTIVAYMGGVSWLRYGYNSEAVRTFKKVPQEQYEFLLEQCIVLVVTETINCALMEAWFRSRLGAGGALRRMGGLLQSNLFLAQLTICLGCMSTDIWPPFIHENFCKLSF